MSKCPVFNVADLVGKKWSVVLIQEVGLNGSKGFNYLLKRMKKVTPKVLSKRLKEFETIGIVKKEILASEVPVRTAYSLTAKGRELQEIMAALKAWNGKHNAECVDCNKKECVSCKLF